MVEVRRILSDDMREMPLIFMNGSTMIFTSKLTTLLGLVSGMYTRTYKESRKNGKCSSAVSNAEEL